MSEEKYKAFRGSIKYPLHRLDHEQASEKSRQLNRKNVERLIKVFQLEGCRRLDAENHVPALIPNRALSILLESVTEGEVRLKASDKEPVWSDTPDRLTYLHGRHRLEAAKRFLPANEKWWVVDLYTDDALSENGVQAIRDEYLNARNFYDGEIFRRLRQCHCTGNQAEKNMWLSRLSEAKQRDVATMEKRQDSESRAFADSLDGLIPFIGLWPALKLGTFHRLLSIRCLEEMTRYLRSIWQIWNYICEGDDALRLQLDISTVDVLEGRCPRYSEDRNYLEARRSDIFPTVRRPQTRENLWQRIMSLDSIIPSLHTFLEDTKYLEPCTKVLKGLLPSKFKGSIQQAFETLHNGQKLLKLQTSENNSRLQDQPSVASIQWKAYRQLWLYAMRHFPGMVGHAPRKVSRSIHCSKSNTQYIYWHGIAELAVACGYERVKRPFLHRVDADVKMTEEFLRRVRPSKHGYAVTSSDQEVRDIVNILQGMDNKLDSGQPAPLGDPCLEDLAHRCGVPFADSFDRDNRLLFLDTIYTPRSREEPLTSFPVKRDMFIRFFGTLDVPSLSSPSRLADDDDMEAAMPALRDLIEDGMMQYDATSDVVIENSAATLATVEYSASEYSQPSGSLTPRPVTHNEPLDQPSSPDLHALVSRDETEGSEPLSGQSVSQAEALKIFWTFRNNTPDSEKMVIIKEESSGRFTIHVLDHTDQRGIIRTVGNRKAFVREGPNSRRQRVAGLVDLMKRQEPCVMVYHPLHERQIE